MNQQTLDRIKQDLLAKKAQLEAEMSGVAEKDASGQDYTADFPSYGDQMDENAQEVSQYTTNLETERVLENTLKDVNNSLKAIEAGTYGICKYCKNEIEEKRLIVRPFSSACVSCKMKMQQS